MPKTMKEEFIFTLMMVPAMVCAMVLYNTAMSPYGLYGASFVRILWEIAVMCLVALVAEFPVIAPLAHKMACKVMDKVKVPPFFVPLVISICTVCIMCPFMSLMATLILKGIPARFLSVWGNTLLMNFPMALSWQLLVAGPLVRQAFRIMFRPAGAPR